MNVINQEIHDKFSLYNADCVDLARSLPDNSIDFSVYSPPFESLFVFSNSERDMGNNASSADFWQHYRYLIADHMRIMKPGRLIAIHCMNLPTSKTRDGYIGLKDFRGEIIRAHQAAGFIYHSEVCIWKDPVVAMQRTKALGLLYKQLRKDSAMSRQGIADYLVIMRKPGDNPDPVTHTHESLPVGLWQKYASPVWMDINQTRTLQYMSARENDDERHISPLQLDVIERAIDLWTNPNDLVYTPFLGIGSEVYTALKMGRRGIGSELKPSYFKLAVENCKSAAVDNQNDLFAEESV
jgi:DNA modification methylase